MEMAWPPDGKKHTMKTRLSGMIGLAGVALILAGCGHSDGGYVKTAPKTDTTADKAGSAVKDLPKDLNSALIITPEVKSAIVGDSVLHDRRNMINVDSHDNVTHLRGHVVSASMKQRATAVARKSLAAHHPDYKVSNELTIAKG